MSSAGTKKANNKELARMKALNELGVTPTAIAKQMGFSHSTVIAYLKSDIYQDPEIQKLVDLIKERELSDLYLLGAKARANLHDKLDNNELKPVELIACQDRSFQQRRLLEGLSTQNVSVFSRTVQNAHEKTLNEAEIKAEDNKQING